MKKDIITQAIDNINEQNENELRRQVTELIQDILHLQQRKKHIEEKIFEQQTFLREIEGYNPVTLNQVLNNGE